MTTFEDLKPLFHQMSHDELQKTVEWLIRDTPPAPLPEGREELRVEKPTPSPSLKGGESEG